MDGGKRVEVEGGFSVMVPGGWFMEPDEDGGVLLGAEDGAGLLHLVSFPQEMEEELDPAEELYTFLEDQGVELEEDEVEDVDLEAGGELSYCEYLTEAEAGEEAEGEPATYWLVGVATAPGRLVFGNYSCPAGAEEAERDTVIEVLSSLRVHAAE